MKKKLFVVAFVLSFYSLCVTVFALADSQGLVAKALSEVGFSQRSTPATLNFNQSFIDPMPEPPRPDHVTDKSFIDPMPEPPRPAQLTAVDFIDPMPEPPRPDLLLAANFIDPMPEPPRP